MQNRLSRRIGILLAAVATLSVPAAAHVDYVTAGGGDFQNPIPFLIDVFSNPLHAALFAGGATATGLAVGGYFYVRPFERDISVARRTLQSYQPYLPWMLRLSLGLPLVGAGFAGYLFSPSVQTTLRLPQIVIGFLLLFGFASRYVAVAGLVTYSAVLVLAWPVPLLAVEYVGGFLAIVVAGSGQPSADGLLRRLRVTDGTVLDALGVGGDPFGKWADKLSAGDWIGPILRLSIGFQFVYLGVTQKLMKPEQAAEVVTKYDLQQVVPVAPEVWVAGAGLTEAAVGLLLLAGVYTRATAAVAFVLFTTTLFGLPDDPVLAHISLFGLTSALLVTGSGKFSIDRLSLGQSTGQPTERAAD